MTALSECWKRGAKCRHCRYCGLCLGRWERPGRPPVRCGRVRCLKVDAVERNRRYREQLVRNAHINSLEDEGELPGQLRIPRCLR